MIFDEGLVSACCCGDLWGNCETLWNSLLSGGLKRIEFKKVTVGHAGSEEIILGATVL